MIYLLYNQYLVSGLRNIDNLFGKYRLRSWWLFLYDGDHDIHDQKNSEKFSGRCNIEVGLTFDFTKCYFRTTEGKTHVCGSV